MIELPLSCWITLRPEPEFQRKAASFRGARAEPFELRESFAMRWRIHPKSWSVSDGDSAGGTPTAAVEMTALPKKSLMIRVKSSREVFPSDSLCFFH
jgi:hypothetical protein